MGNEASLPELCSTFDVEEIKRLGKRFKKLDLDGSGSLSVEEFMSLPELQQNPLVARVIEIFDTDGNGEVDFKEFIEGMSQFSVKGNKEAKLNFAFKIYDVDKDGYISNGELFQVSLTVIKFRLIAYKPSPLCILTLTITFTYLSLVCLNLPPKIIVYPSLRIIRPCFMTSNLVSSGLEDDGW